MVVGINQRARTMPTRWVTVIELLGEVILGPLYLFCVCAVLWLQTTLFLTERWSGQCLSDEQYHRMYSTVIMLST